jgi:hypothetical protein
MSKGNSPAFPCVDRDKRMWTGMNLRDYFALEAVNALIRNVPHDPAKAIEPDVLAMLSYKIADAMLDEREKYR